MKVLVLSQDVIGKSMAGPGIRCWEFAKSLSGHHDVTLSSIFPSDLAPEEFKLIHLPNKQAPKAIKEADVVITQVVTTRMAYAAYKGGTKLIYDAYDPLPVEQLEVVKFASQMQRTFIQKRTVDRCLFALEAADAVLYANERQRDLWQGLLLANSKLGPRFYDRDSSLDSFFKSVPFGLPDTPFVKKENQVRKQFGLSEDDHILVWGGGVWNWFDPITLIKAMERFRKSHPQIKLVFMGIKHPNESIPEMKMTTEAIQLARELDLIDKNVFFNFGWMPYDERVSLLAESSIGVSMHQKHLETRYSFRTRLLDYIWAGLPIIATEGDAFADLIQQRELGIVVPYYDVDALEKAVLQVLEDVSFQKKVRKNLQEVSQEYCWGKVTKPIIEIIDSFGQVREDTLTFMKILRAYFWARRPTMVGRWLYNKVC